MSWRMRVRHSTEYTYAEPVLASYNEARISPMDTASQFTLEHRVDVEPAANLFRYRDHWGTRVHAFDLHHEHSTLRVIGTSTVETAQRLPTVDDTVAWEALRSPGLIDRFFEFLAPTPATAPDDAIRAAAKDIGAASSPAGAVEQLGAWLRARLEYRPGTTHVSTTAGEALEVGGGVCQDFVHLGLAVLRAAGIPARYASGYLYPNVRGELGATYEGQSHAWFEAWAGDWHPIDPTSGAPVAERHVLVARGRDYGDVSPLKGIYHGGSTHTMAVSVELTRVA